MSDDVLERFEWLQESLYGDILEYPITFQHDVKAVFDDVRARLESVESLQAEVERLRNPPFQPTHRHRRSGRLYQLVRLEDGKLTGGGWYLGASYKNDKGQYYWTDWRRWNEKFSALPNAEQEGDSD